MSYYLWTDEEMHRGLYLGSMGVVHQAWHEIEDFCDFEDDFRILVDIGSYAVDDTDVPPDVFTQAQNAGRRFLRKYRGDRRFSSWTIGMVQDIVAHKPQFKRRRGKVKRRKRPST